MTLLSKVLASENDPFLKEIHDYVNGMDSPPTVTSKGAREYKKNFDKKFKKSGKSSLVLYRGFGWENDLREEDSWIIENPDVINSYSVSDDALLSFTENEAAAASFAKLAVEDSDFSFGFLIKVTVPADKIWWHWKLDPVGLEHPKEKEVIIQPNGLKYQILKTFESEMPA